MSVFNLGGFWDKRYIWKSTWDGDWLSDYVNTKGLIETSDTHPYVDDLINSIPGTWTRPELSNCRFFATKNFDGTYIEGEDLLLLIYDETDMSLFVLYHWNF